MKTKLLILGLLVAVNAAFAQGKVSFVNDSAHQFVWHPDVPLVGGQPIAGIHPWGVTLVAGLYAGTSSTSMALQSSTTLLTGTGLPQPGRMASRLTLLSGIPGGVPQWFQIWIWDAAYASPFLSQTWFALGYSPLFQATPGTSITYPSIMPGGPSASTLPAALNIVVGVPEPTSAALLFLGFLLLRLSARCHNRPN